MNLKGTGNWRRIASFGLVVVTASSLAVIEADPRAGATTAKPNFVLIVTDDQRADTLRYMPIVRRELIRKGIRFSNGYVVNPVCCPSRASLLTGAYSHTTGVYTNHPRQPYGGFPAFRDGSTIATWLDTAGYRTALLGKYLNGYGREPYIPPGWDRWFATYEEGGYYDYAATVDGEQVTYGTDPDEYGTTVLEREAITFISETDAATPLFLYLAVHAPHKPATPAPGDSHAYSDLSPWRPRSYDEADVSDKPAWLSDRARLSSTVARRIDRFRLEQIRSLQSVDRAVGSIVDALDASGRLPNTMIVFASDNGFLWGEHRWDSKGVPYEESVKVPFVVRYDALVHSPRVDEHLVLNIDVAPTFARLAGVDAPRAEGRSLVPLLSSPDSAWRKVFLIEHLSLGEHGVPTYCAVHTVRYVMIRYVTGESELYDLARDPAQLSNVAGEPTYATRMSDLNRSLRELCSPTPPGFSL
jgi:arylsulfatase A-like enzyme